MSQVPHADTGHPGGPLPLPRKKHSAREQVAENQATTPCERGAASRLQTKPASPMGSSARQMNPYPAGVPRQLDYPPISAAELLRQAAQHVPEQTAIRFLGRAWTYRQVDRLVVKLASWLQQHGVHGGQRVGLLLPNCPEYLIGLYAIWRAGGVAVALSPLSVADELRKLLELTDCRLVVTLDLLQGLLSESRLQNRLLVSLSPYLPKWKQAGYQFANWRRNGWRTTTTGHDVYFWDAVDQGCMRTMPVECLPQADPAYILSTGGTTGDPKAVTLSHANIVANAWQQKHWIASSGEAVTLGQERLLAVLPFFHSYGMSTMLATGCAIGAELIMLPRFQVESTIRTIESRRPTILHAVPAMLAALNQRLRRREADLSSIKWVISGGASLLPEIADEFSTRSGALVVEGYGLSEASPVTHVGPLDGSNVPGTIGLPLPDTQCRIMDIATGTQQLTRGEVGELLIRGPQVMLGYWENSPATQQVLDGGWLHTGDLARVRQDGFYEIVDRKKDLIITSGFNVYPADVEQVLREHQDIADVAVIGIPDKQKGEVVKAFVVLRKGVRWNQSRFEKYCRARLAKHRRPRVWELVTTELPKNFLGKVMRRELRSAGGAS